MYALCLKCRFFVVILQKFVSMVNICVTEDGSHTLFSEMAGQTYHSSHGAVQESSHIFISQLTVVSGQGSMVDGLQVVRDGSLTVLEIGF